MVEKALPDMPVEHEGLLEALRQMRDAIGALRQRDGAWQALAAGSLEGAAGALESHCASSEAPEGLLSEVEREAGHSRNVASAHRDHEVLCAKVDQLHELASGGLDPVRALDQAEEIVTLLRKHLDLVNDLAYEAALGPESGAGD